MEVFKGMGGNAANSSKQPVHNGKLFPFQILEAVSLVLHLFSSFGPSSFILQIVYILEHKIL